MIKKVLVILLVALVIIQLFHPKKNTAQAEQPNHISKAYAVPADVKSILDKACIDCHSNNTIYPWYSKVQPIDWWMTGHINEGKEELNFDEFATYAPRRQYRKMEEVIKQIKEDEMPLNSYTWIHKNAILNDTEKKTVIDWATTIREELKNKYPIDSLERPKK